MTRTLGDITNELKEKVLSPAKEEAERMVGEARSQADNIIIEAKKEASQIKEKAKKYAEQPLNKWNSIWRHQPGILSFWSRNVLKSRLFTLWLKKRSSLSLIMKIFSVQSSK